MPGNNYFKSKRGPHFLKKLPFDQVRIHRRLNCPLYNMCLRLACAKGWISFTCQQCGKWANLNRAQSGLA